MRQSYGNMYLPISSMKSYACKQKKSGLFPVKLFILKSLQIHTQPSEMTQRDPAYALPSFPPKLCSRISASLRALIQSRYRTFHHHGVSPVASVQPCPLPSPRLAPAATAPVSMSVTLPFREGHISGVTHNVTCGTAFFPSATLPGDAPGRRVSAASGRHVSASLLPRWRLFRAWSGPTSWLQHSPLKVVWVASHFWP